MNKLLEYLDKGFSKRREQLVQRPKDRVKYVGVFKDSKNTVWREGCTWIGV